MRWFWLFLIALVALNAAAPSDYVTLFSHTPICGGYKEPACETVYKISIPALEPAALSVDQDDFKVSFRKESDLTLAKSPSFVKDAKIEINGKEVNRDSLSESFLPGQTYLVRITAKRQWVFNGVDYETQPIDNVLTVFGRDYTEYAWWNTTFNYKRNTTFLVPTAFSRNVTWIFNANFSTEAAAGKVDYNGTCIRFVNANENGEITFEHEPSNLSVTNYTAFVFQNLPTGGVNNTVWLYYGNLGTCQEGFGNVNNLWNQTGAAIISHLAFDTFNSSSFLDSADGDQNFTKIGTLAMIKTPLGMGFQKTGGMTNYALGSGKKFNNYPQGTVVFWVNLTDVTSAGSLNPQLITRGNNTAASTDLFIDYAVTGIRCSLDGAATGPVSSTPSLNTWFMQACTWNTSGLFNYRNGMPEGTVAFTTGLPNNALRTQLVLGGWIGATNSGLHGSMTDVAFYNRSLSMEELQLIYNTSKAIYGAESNFTADPDISPTITVNAYDETTGNAIYFNATFDNTTSTFTFPTALSYVNGTGNFTQGISTITFNNASYYSRIVIATISNSSQTINAYLLPLGFASANFVRFHVQSQTLAPIEGATVTFQKIIGGSLVTVGSCLTDSTGTCAQYLDLLSSYTITAQASGYTSQSNAITPVGSDYTFTLSSSSDPSYSVDFANITLSFSPEYLNFLQNWTIINWTVGSSDSQLTSWGLNISYGGTIIYNSSFTTPSGGVVLVNVSTLGRVGNLTASGFFQKAGRPFFYYTQKYYIYQNVSNSASGLSNMMNAWAAQAKSPFVVGFLAILVTGVIVGSVGTGLSIGIGLGVLTAFILFFISGFLVPIGGNHTEWGFLGLLVLLGLAMMKLRSGQ